MKTTALELTPKQRLFCDEYLIDRNATRAALRAGYSVKTALGGHLMVIPKIKWYIEQHTQATAKKLKVNHEMILNELCKIAFGNMGNFFGADGSLKPMHEMDPDDKAALWSLSGVKKAAVADAVAGDEVVKIRMYNKLSALDKIAKHLNFYKPELKLPETEHVYMDFDEMNSYDAYDDDEYFERDEEEERIIEEEGEESDSCSEVSGNEEESNGTRDTRAPAVDAAHVVAEELAFTQQKEPEPEQLQQQQRERFRGAIAQPERVLTDNEKLDAALNKELKAMNVNRRNYDGLSISGKMRLLREVRAAY